ncbi:glycosyltransferase family 2 protein [Bacillus luteolus]|uniref:Glycosyltransferase family 2 protein n=1 Tax=Litchfieldia luteola TaxID=682179 RepID=A0ABR9QEJ0_9BACI|nr:glycosyltransferase family 2 protein [Cytobacillus luteolus]MBE4906905.1 glycosyltransferase family 2 protein [Cytobacillus luteolus]MBP1943632.1 glycosyltransferase involved in cell wall biosynthesis [Cytobacillus luteolus]
MIEPKLTIVVPCYNEEEMLPETFICLGEFLEELISSKMISEQSKLLFVDDGSKDKTWSLIYKAGLANPLIKGLKLSKNVGHQNALLAGLFTAKEHSDCMVSIDADLQDDVTVIKDFVQKFTEGYEIVYGVRRERSTDTFFKRNTALGFYRLMKKMGVDLIYNHADFRLMSKRAVEELEKFEETNFFLRGIVPLIGFQSTEVFYNRKERFAGETKYPLRKMLSFALDGITSFSVTPIRFISLIGFLSFFISLVFGAYFLLLKLTGNTTTGWTSLITSIWLIGGLQLIGVGLIGEYVGKIYKEAKRRPKFIIDINTFNLALKSGQTLTVEKEQEQLGFTGLPKTN